MDIKRNKLKFIIGSLVLIVALIILDQASKYLAVNILKDKSDIILIKGIFQLHYLENTGAAFSMLEGKQIFFAILTPILVAILFFILYRLPFNKKYLPLQYIIIFIIAGAIGNYIDRILNHYVVDFLYFSLINFPVFNVADIYVTCSVILLILLILFYYKDQDFEEISASIKFK